MSRLTSTPKGFFIVRTRVADRRACSNGIARSSKTQGKVTELLGLFGETQFKIPSFDRAESAPQRSLRRHANDRAEAVRARRVGVRGAGHWRRGVPRRPAGPISLPRPAPLGVVI